MWNVRTNSEYVTLSHPVMPVLDGFRGGIVWIDGGQLGKRDRQQARIGSNAGKCWRRDLGEFGR